MASEEVIVQASQALTGVAEFSRAEHATVGALYMICGIGGVATNSMLILTLWKDKALFRGSTAWLHINLAVANVFVVAPSPLPASSHFSGKWLYGDKLCQVYAFEGMFVGIAAIGAVICLCLERYVVSCRKDTMPQSSSTFYWFCTSLNVANAFFWAVMPILGWSSYSRDKTGATCAIDWIQADEGYFSYMAMLCTFSFGIPMLVALLCLYKSIPSDATSADPRASTSAGTSSASGSGSGATSGGQDAGLSSFTESQLRWLCLTLLGLVLVGWGPFAALCLWAMVADTAGVSMLAACLPPLACKSCTMLYPLVYAVANGRFRAGYLAMMGAGPDPVTSGKGE